MNTLTAAELKRRGMAAIDDGLRHGPVHLMKRNKPPQWFSPKRTMLGWCTARRVAHPLG